MSEAVTVHFLHKDGSESSAVIEPDATGSYTLTAPEGAVAMRGAGVTWAEALGARIGRGGGGPDPSIPECPVCGAHGGGGHGGLCPNMGKPPEEWSSVAEEMPR